MNSFLAVVLVCAATVPGPDCDRSNARDVAVRPVETVAACAHVGQVLAAQAFGAQLGGLFIKIGCERRKAS